MYIPRLFLLTPFVPTKVCGNAEKCAVKRKCEVRILIEQWRTHLQTAYHMRPLVVSAIANEVNTLALHRCHICGVHLPFKIFVNRIAPYCSNKCIELGNVLVIFRSIEPRRTMINFSLVGACQRIRQSRRSLFASAQYPELVRAVSKVDVGAVCRANCTP